MSEEFGSRPRSSQRQPPADHSPVNRSTARRETETDEPMLPSLEDGITLLDVGGGRGVPVVQSLVLDHLLLQEGPAFWVDANGHARTTSLARLSPGRRLLDRIHVARGFTAYQHYGAVCDLPLSSETPSLVVVPALDAPYRADDALGRVRARTLLTRALARLAACADDCDVPVLVTRTANDEFAAPIQAIADRLLECERTRLGPRFVGEEFETLAYPIDGGTLYQTTVAYWRRLLRIRADQVGLRPASSLQPTGGDEDVAAGTTTDAATATLAPDPLLDALAQPAGAGGW